eukprot:TRINITY_DN1033_c0_g2_i1.p1 TRINITY_DN1033_c0_g2~~TRINITY_DN1033_c0_g2_i1.p1  ORF type:complete len:197 (+),score=31.03 TRINITY_DN1033_c0_g2_i1:610-1200(+)
MCCVCRWYHRNQRKLSILRVAFDTRISMMAAVTVLVVFLWFAMCHGGLSDAVGVQQVSTRVFGDCAVSQSAAHCMDVMRAGVSSNSATPSHFVGLQKRVAEHNLRHCERQRTARAKSAQECVHSLCTFADHQLSLTFGSGEGILEQTGIFCFAKCIKKKLLKCVRIENKKKKRSCQKRQQKKCNKKCDSGFDLDFD